MKPAKSLEQFFEDCEWPKELATIREILLETELEEGLKWGMPAYMINGKNVLALGSFKKHFGIWFHHGVFLTDPKEVLRNVQEGKTVAMRQWRFENAKEIKKSWIKQYALEAIQNQKEGLEVKPKRRRNVKIVIPDELAAAFKEKKSSKAHFEKLTPGKQRDIVDYINQAKRQSTKDNRVVKCIELMKEGKSPMDMYR